MRLLERKQPVPDLRAASGSVPSFPFDPAGVVPAEQKAIRGRIRLNRGAAADGVALAFLALLVLLLNLPLILGDSVLTDYDLLAYFYPYWELRDAAFRTG